MPFLPEVTEEQAGPELKKTYEQIRQAYGGWVPSFFTLQGSHPELVAAELAMAGVVMGPGEIDPNTKEFVGLAVSVFNTSSYCIDKHMEVLRKMGIPHKVVRQLTFGVDETEVTEELKALARFAQKITFRPTEITEGDFEALRQKGFSDRAILEAVAVAAWWNFINRMAIALGAVPEVR